jgi:hypothetical protein
VSPYEFGTDAVQQYHSQYLKISALPQALVAYVEGWGLASWELELLW